MAPSSRSPIPAVFASPAPGETITPDEAARQERLQDEFIARVQARTEAAGSADAESGGNEVAEAGDVAPGDGVGQSGEESPAEASAREDIWNDETFLADMRFRALYGHTAWLMRQRSSSESGEGE